MRTFQRFLSILTVFAVMSGPALVAAAQTADSSQNQQYDSPSDTQTAPDQDRAEDRPLEQPDTQAAPQDDQAAQPNYDQQPMSEAPPAPATADQQASNMDANQQAPTDPPARAARLQYMTGSISVQPQGTGDWVAGELNRPLTNSDNIWADKDSRAEISVGAGLIRIGSESSLTLTNISENTVQLQLHQGALNLHIRRLYDNERYEVDTPNQAFTVLKPGDYRFDVNPDTDKTVITVWRGEGDSTGDGPSVHIHANEQARFSNGTSMQVDIHEAPAADQFDEWASSRDHRLDNSASAKYVSPDVPGYEDLDEYGSWKNTEEYGDVWYPSVAPGWAPYVDGHWIYQYPWGWTWVDYEPWGYAPFHYGRWVFAGGFWGWAPGPLYVRPYYAPALVAWFGGGWGFGVGFGGGFGWCPLGFHDPFIPWYGASRFYFNRVNFTNGRFFAGGRFGLNGFYDHHFRGGRFDGGRGFNMRYDNLHVRGGFTAVSRTTIVNSMSVAHNHIRVSPNQMSRMTAVHSLGVAPTRASRLGSAGARAIPPSRAFARPVVSRLAAPGRNSVNHGSFNGGARANMGARAGFNGNAGRPNQVGANQRPGFGGVNQAGVNRGATNRGPAFNNSRPMPNVNSRPAPTMNSRPMPNANSRTMPNAGMRSVPRPPNAGNFGGRAMNGSRPSNGMGSSRMSSPEMASRGNVPRPPSSSMGSPSMGRGGPSYSPQRGASPSYSPRGASPSYSQRGGAQAAPRPSAPRSSGPRSEMSVPRPSQAVANNNRSYTNRGYVNQAYNRGSESYGARSYSRSPAYDDGGRSYSRPSGAFGGSSGRSSMPSYGGRSYGRASAAPSYGGGSYGRPSYGNSMPSYGGRASNYGGGFSGRSAGSFGGARSSGGFGGGHVSSGGGHASFGGGGHASFGGGGGGGHSGGGGGGHSGGGGHGHR